jgi:hypothetical protein
MWKKYPVLRYAYHSSNLSPDGVCVPALKQCKAFSTASAGLRSLSNPKDFFFANWQIIVNNLPLVFDPFPVSEVDLLMEDGYCSMMFLQFLNHKVGKM